MKSFAGDHLVRQDIAAMEPYSPILPFEVLSASLGRPTNEITKLDANENPYGPSAAALAAAGSGKWYHIYPDGEVRQVNGDVHLGLLDSAFYTDPLRLLNAAD